MKASIIALAFLTFASLSANALARPRVPGHVYPIQCARQVQATGIKKVCHSAVHGTRPRFFTLTDAKGNGFAFSIVSATANPPRGTERVTQLTLQLAGEISDGAYKALPKPDVAIQVEQRLDVRKGALIQLLKGNFTRVGEVSASNFQNILYPQ